MKKLMTLLALALSVPTAALADCWPSPETCSDPEWINSDCAWDWWAVETCRWIVEEQAYEAAANAEPEYVDGEWHYNEHMDHGDFFAWRWGNVPIYSAQLHEISAMATAEGQMPWWVSAERDWWDYNGEVTSCEEYVHEKYLDHARFEDSVAHLAGQPQAIIAIAEALPVLRDAMGEPLPEPEPLAASPYAAAPMELLAAEPALEETFEARLDEPAYAMAEPAPDWADPVAVDQAEMARVDAARFATLMDESLALDAEIDATIEAIFAGDESAASHNEELQREREQMNAVLTEELLMAQDAGCLGGFRCDLAPSLVAEHTLKRFDTLREADYRACREATDSEEGMSGLSNRAFFNLDGSVMMPARDYTRSADDLSSYFTARRAWKAEIDLQAAAKQRAAEEAAEQAEQAEREAKERAAAIAKAKAVLQKSDGSLGKLAKNYEDNMVEGNHAFNAALRYKLEWRVFDFERVLCNVNAKFEALLDTSVTLWAKRFELFYARFYVTLKRYEEDIRVLNGGLYKHKNHKDLLGKLKWNLAKDTKALKIKEGVSVPFTIVFVPASVKVGFAGKLGLAYDVTAGVETGGATCEKVDAYVKGTVKPFISLDGFAEFAVDLWVARAGIGGRLQLIELALPMFAKVALSAPLGDIRKLELVLEAGMDIAVSTLKGALYIFGELGPCPFCIKGKTDIFKWKGFSAKESLFKSKLRLPLFGLQQLKAGG